MSWCRFRGAFALPLTLAGCDVYQTVITNRTENPVYISSKGGKGCDVQGIVEPRQKLFLECDSRTLFLEVSGRSVGKCHIDPARVQIMGIKYKGDDRAVLASGQDTQREIPISESVCQ